MSIVRRNGEQSSHHPPAHRSAAALINSVDRAAVAVASTMASNRRAARGATAALRAELEAVTAQRDALGVGAAELRAKNVTLARRVAALNNKTSTHVAANRGRNTEEATKTAVRHARTCRAASAPTKMVTAKASVAITPPPQAQSQSSHHGEGTAEKAAALLTYGEAMATAVVIGLPAASGRHLQLVINGFIGSCNAGAADCRRAADTASGSSSVRGVAAPRPLRCDTGRDEVPARSSSTASFPSHVSLRPWMRCRSAASSFLRRRMMTSCSSRSRASRSTSRCCLARTCWMRRADSRCVRARTPTSIWRTVACCTTTFSRAASRCRFRSHS